MSPAAEEPEALLAPGYVIASKYRIEKVLGRGGMGLVLKARHLQLGRPCAIKVPHQKMLEHPRAVPRFLKEAHAAATLEGEHVVRIHDVDELESGLPYIVMEYLEGEDLAARLQTQGPLPLTEAVDFVLQACVALAEAHAQGIVHRDLKPANLFCIRSKDGQLRLKVLDFGISKTRLAHSSSSASLTQHDAVLGSPRYMSPEQCLSAKNVDHRTDIWALGVILYELSSGRVPFSGESLQGLGMRIANSRPVPICELRPSVPSALNTVVFRCLEKSVSDRYATVAELAQALVPFGSERARGYAEHAGRLLQVSADASLRSDVASAATLQSVDFDSSGKSSALADAVPHTQTLNRATHVPVSTDRAPGDAVPGLKRERSRYVVGLVAALAVSAGAWMIWSAGDTQSAAAPELAMSLSSVSPNPTATLDQTAIPPQVAASSDATLPGSLSVSPNSPSTSSVPVSPTASPTASPIVSSSGATRPSDVKPGLGASRAAAIRAVNPSGGSSPVTAPRTAPATSQRASCDPPYTVDAEGNKRFIPSCF